MQDNGDFEVVISAQPHEGNWLPMDPRTLRDAERNVLRTQPPVSSTYARDGGHIAYGGGSFEIGPDEALILEVTPPDCHFWNIHVGDYWGQSLGYTYRQTSLNGHQAVLDEDGVFRAVVAHRDPGVANWLDTAGNTFTRCVYRWWLASTQDLPAPTVRKVMFDDVLAALPATTARVGVGERREVLGRRRAAVLKRYFR
ncbi:DUF1214 domain-containing protein [Rhodococcus sp. TAF43]|uniref:DUF1214 domain-containing protein n=1 Tax=unclassified Rhodococcus (in: high G+C Gram-positive bacteria) TaxID=192944 RepID=UPI0020C5E0DC|nr:DUF1214 domain-containing protein [Rhodococcus sp. W8901]